MKTFETLATDYKSRFIFNNVKKVEYECFDFVEQNEDNEKTLKKLNECTYICSFINNLTTFIYKSKSYFIIRAYVHVIVQKDEKVQLQVYYLQHSSLNNNCKAKFEYLPKHTTVYENVNVAKLVQQLTIIRNVDFLSKKEDRHFGMLTLNMEFEFQETLKTILNDTIKSCINA